MDNKEFIKSIRKKIETKKKALNLDTELLYLDSLKKYTDLTDFKFPKKATQSYPIKRDVNNRFKDIKDKSFKGIAACCYVYDNIIREISKGVINDIENCVDKTNDYASELNNYISKNTQLKTVYVTNCDDEGKAYLTTLVIQKRNKTFVQEENTFLSFTSKYKDKEKNHYFSAKNIIHTDNEGEYSLSAKNIHYCSIKDVYKPIATYFLAKCVYNYIYNNNIYPVIEEYMETVYELSDKTKEEFRNLSEETLLSIIEDNEFTLPTIIRVFLAISTVYMLRWINEISNYEERIRNLSGDFAKTYMTKKNIPKSTLNFMTNNKFLEMFGFVEADADSDLDKLRKLEDEFVSLSNKIPLVISKDHSFRFRKLGNINRNPRERVIARTGGVYYPGFNTLAIDLDSIRSFIHEYFHLIDYTNNILSLNKDFETIIYMYRDYMDEYADRQGEGSVIYTEWFNAKGKYDRSYYRSCDEIFARAGEIYVHEILGIKTSFNHIDFSTDRNKLVYPLVQPLLDEIKKYFDNLFKNIRNKCELVTFNTSNKNELIEESKQKTNTHTLDYKELLKDKNETYTQVSMWDLFVS